MTDRDPPRQADPERIRELAAMRAPLPKRFYKAVSVREEANSGHTILLDGRQVRTPGKRLLTVPSSDLARPSPRSGEPRSTSSIPPGCP